MSSPEVKCVKCGHNDVEYDGLCAAPIPLIDKEPHGSQRCRCACVFPEVKGVVEEGSVNTETDNPSANADFEVERRF
jgi:hypothetical protein